MTIAVQQFYAIWDCLYQNESRGIFETVRQIIDPLPRYKKNISRYANAIQSCVHKC